MIRVIDYTLKTAASAEPISVTEAKLHLRVDLSTDDTLITALIVAAREFVEKYTGRILMSSTYYGYADKADSGGWELTACPVSALSSIKYYDASHTLQTWSASNYLLNETRTPTRVTLTTAGSLPTTYNEGGQDWVFEFVCGYANAAAVPAPIKAALLLMVGHLYEHREAVIIGTISSELPMSVEYLLNPYIVWR